MAEPAKSPSAQQAKLFVAIDHKDGPRHKLFTAALLWKPVLAVVQGQRADGMTALLQFDDQGRQ